MAADHDERRQVFDETSLHQAIIKTWGEHGAHNEVFTWMRHELERLRDRARRWGPCDGCGHPYREDEHVPGRSKCCPDCTHTAAFSGSCPPPEVGR